VVEVAGVGEAGLLRDQIQAEVSGGEQVGDPGEPGAETERGEGVSVDGGAPGGPGLGHTINEAPVEQHLVRDKEREAW